MAILNFKNSMIRERHDKAELSTLRCVAKNAVGGQSKRIYDVCVALVLLLLLFPLFIIVAAMLKVADPGPVISKHVRIGLWGRRFTCFKFRTTAVDSENVLGSQKLVKNLRVTPVGQMLRESSLDELPQLINVLRGEMSLVGPRPIDPSEMSHYGDRLRSYVSARPGLTGAWQISGRSDCGYDKRAELDAHYVSNWRFSTDLFILLRTVRAVIDRERSY